MRSSSLTFLRLIGFFILALGAIVVLNLIWLLPTIQSMYSSASILALEIVERARTDVDFSLQTIEKELEKGAAEITFEPERKKIIIERILKYNTVIRSIGVVNREGKETFLLDRFKFVTPADFRDYGSSSFFVRALQGETSFGDIHVSLGLEPYIAIATPVSKGGIIGEILVADVSIRNLVSAIHTPNIKEGHIYVVDKDGYQIIHPDLNELLRHLNFSDRAIVQKVIRDQVIADGLAPDDGYVNEKGEHAFAVGMPVSIANLSIFFEQPRSQALADVNKAIIFAVITTLLAAGIVLFIMRGNRKLQRLNATFKELLQENSEVGKILVRRDIELTEANTRLLALDTTKSEFVSVAAHQLRTPITGIRWSFNALLDREMGEINSDQQKLLEDGLKSSIRMIDLINDLLNVARIEEGRFGLRFKKQPFDPIMQDIIESHRNTMEEKGILFFLDMQPGIPSLNIDEEKMNIALDNIFDNAIKYTSPGGTITVSIKEEKNYLRVSVNDTGIGIPKDQTDKLFVKFFRADNALRFQTSGSGLGLYVVKNIIEAHGGTVTVGSEENKGTTISFTLPIPDR